MRLIIGISVGIAIVLGGIWYLGIQLPEDPPENVDVAKAIGNAVSGAAHVTQKAVEKIDETIESVQQAADSGPAQGETEKPQVEVVEQKQVQAEIPVSEVVPPTPEVSYQQFFWKPFQTRIQANGFAEQLTKSSGVNCQAVRNEKGFYRIYFEYADEADLQNKISRLTEAGGLIELYLDQT